MSFGPSRLSCFTAMLMAVLSVPGSLSKRYKEK